MFQAHLPWRLCLFRLPKLLHIKLEKILCFQARFYFFLGFLFRLSRKHSICPQLFLCTGKRSTNSQLITADRLFTSGVSLQVHLHCLSIFNCPVSFSNSQGKYEPWLNRDKGSFSFVFSSVTGAFIWCVVASSIVPSQTLLTIWMKHSHQLIKILVYCRVIWQGSGCWLYLSPPNQKGRY